MDMVPSEKGKKIFRMLTFNALLLWPAKPRETFKDPRLNALKTVWSILLTATSTLLPSQPVSRHNCSFASGKG